MRSSNSEKNCPMPPLDDGKGREIRGEGIIATLVLLLATPNKGAARGRVCKAVQVLNKAIDRQSVVPVLPESHGGSTRPPIDGAIPAMVGSQACAAVTQQSIRLPRAWLHMSFSPDRFFAA